MSKTASGQPDPRWSPQWKRLRVECYRRDKARQAPCHICGQPIRYDLKPSSHPDSYEPDHLRSVNRYPELALLPENVGPSHMKCNRARGKKAGLNAMGNQTRDWRAGR